MRLGISFKINLIVLMVVLSLGASMGVFFIKEQQQNLHNELNRRIELIGGGLSRSVESALTHNDITTMDRILQSFSLDPEFSYVIVKSVEGEILAAHWAGQTKGDVQEHSFTLHAIPIQDTSAEYTHLFGAAEDLSGESVIGNLTIGVDLSVLQAARNRLIERTAIFVLLASFLAMLIGIYLVRHILKRSIEPLLANIREIGDGDLSSRVTPIKNDEIGDIGKAFNSMAEQLALTLVSKQELETTIEERTADLKEALDLQVTAQKALSEQEERVRLLLNSTAEAIYGLDMTGNCIFCNPACVRMLGYESAEELFGKNMHDLIHHSRADGSPYPVSECNIFKAFKEGNSCHIQDEVLWKSDGTCFPAEYWSYPVIKENQAVVGAVVTFIDISERLHLENQLIQSQKLEGIGILAGGIAHDFNNLLTPILGYAEMTLNILEEGHPARKKIKSIHDAANRAADLTHQILAFSRKQTLDMKLLDLNHEVTTAELMLKRIIGEDIKVQLKLAPVSPVIKADSSQLMQVILNLTVNARDAMPDGGTLTIETSVIEIDNPAVWLARDLNRGEYALLSITDTGIGMSEDTRRNIFEPFFTTKQQGKGTGLGLSTAYGIIKQHCGDITVYSELGRGTTFRIYLPFFNELPEKDDVELVSLDAKGTYRILVVEDDNLVREFITEILSAHGYLVTSAAGGKQAIDVVLQSDFDLLISDVVMPEMNGLELFDKLSEMKPGLKAFFISGYPEKSGSLQDLFDCDEKLLHKPFTIESLLQKVEEALA